MAQIRVIHMLGAGQLALQRFRDDRKVSFAKGGKDHAKWAEHLFPRSAFALSDKKQDG